MTPEQLLVLGTAFAAYLRIFEDFIVSEHTNEMVGCIKVMLNPNFTYNWHEICHKGVLLDSNSTIGVRFEYEFRNKSVGKKETERTLQKGE